MKLGLYCFLRTLFVSSVDDVDTDIVQLSREHFTARIRLEETLRWNALRVLTFFLLLVAFTASLVVCDDIQMISEIHQAMESLYGFDDIENLHNPDDVLDYIQAFILQSYKMASALVDANTLDSIDVVRCFSEDMDDICRLRYWSLPMYNRSAPNYLDEDALLADTLSLFNVNSSVMDCSQPYLKSNCINRSDDRFINASLSHPTFGLLPEQPIVVDSRLRFPIGSVVILTPVVWQTRSPRVPCSGFGSRYIKEVMRPSGSANTAFSYSRPAPRTGRSQTIFLSYEEDAFICVDRSKTVDSTFFDRSWHPWVTYEELRVGQPTTPVLFVGKPVYYKFLSDVSYIQAPTPGAVKLTDDPCTDLDVCQGLSKDDSACVDPLQVGLDHPVWSISPNLTYRTCSARSVWDSMFLNIPQESWSELRQSTFFTIETSELNVASLVITPQMDGKQTVVTLVRVCFTVEQSGFMYGRAYLQSTADKTWAWYVSSVVVLFIAVIYFVITWHSSSSSREWSPGCWTKVYDTILCLGCSADIISGLIIDLTLPRVSDDLLNAFRSNSQQAYFNIFSSIASNNNRLQAGRTYGFVLITLLFGRLCLYASLHPRCGVMVSTLARSADDLLHFVVYVGCAEAFLAFFAFWAFGPQLVEYSKLSNVFWSQFLMSIGQFSLPSEAPDFVFFIYVITYVFIIFILMANFLVAIVVDAYMLVQESVKDDKSESSIVADVADVFKMWLLSRMRGSPSPREVWRYLSTGGLGTCDVVGQLPAVTPDELLANVTKKDGSRAFHSLGEARAYCRRYAYKVEDEGVYTLLESRKDLLFPPGQFFDIINLDLKALKKRRQSQENDEASPRIQASSSLRERLGRQDVTEGSDGSSCAHASRGLKSFCLEDTQRIQDRESPGGVDECDLELQDESRQAACQGSSLMNRRVRSILQKMFKTSRVPLTSNTLQLNREHFAARIRLEETLRCCALDLFTFAVLLVAFMASLLIFDDVTMLSQIHEAMRSFYGTDGVENFQSPDEIINFFQSFIVQSYKMASALVDANTLDSIDVARCFDEEINDVCRLKYWLLPTYNSSAPNYLDLDALLADTLSPFNVNSSVMDCSKPNPKSNCINRSDDKFMNVNLTRPTFGLLPEQPVILDSRLRFPLASVVLLTPVVWQARSPTVPCVGFGGRYNEEVMRSSLGGGTAFTSSRSPLRTNRTQTVFLSYEVDAFSCVDRSRLVDSIFFDRSWHPWATYDEMHVGQPTTSVLFAGKPVYYKFVSDVSYMQAPTPGAARVTSDPCTETDICQTLSKDDVACVDPLQAGPDHPVWSDSMDLTYRNCSARSVWDSIYLNSPQESWSNMRENTFFTMETSELNIASLVITPQMDGVQNVVTMVRVSFTVKQSGFIHGKAYIESTSDKMWTWYFSCALVLAMAIIYFVVTWRKSSYAHELSLGRRGKVYNTIVCLGCSAHVISSLIIDLTLPDVSDGLLEAFRSNSQEEYFRALSNVVTYNQRLQAGRTFGFIVITLLFGRLCLYASLHPRLALLVRTLARSADDLLHFVIYIGCVEAFLAVFSFWAFGHQMVEYSNWPNVLWTQFSFFILAFSLPAKPAGFLYGAYVFSYVLMVAILMTNFLIATIVEAYLGVNADIKDDKSESSIVFDVADLCKMLVVSRVRGWASSRNVWRYLSTRGLGTCEGVSSLPAVTAEELLAHVTKLDGSPAFQSLEESRAYCICYAYKVQDEGAYPLLETRKECMFPPGQSFDATNFDLGGRTSSKESYEDVARSRHSQHSSASASPTRFASVGVANNTVEQEVLMKVRGQIARDAPKRQGKKSRVLPDGGGCCGSESGEKQPFLEGREGSSASLDSADRLPSKASSFIRASHRQSIAAIQLVQELVSGIAIRTHCSQLNRHNFTARIRLEMTLRWYAFHLLTFTLLLVTFMANLLVFDNIPMLSQVHQAMQSFYGTDDVENLHSPDDIIDYVQSFIVQSYKIASALVDANTKDSIDVVRCFDEGINDVCRLKYWSMPFYNSSAPNYVDFDTLLADTLSTLNVNSSVMDCTQPNPKSNCINRSDDRFINRDLSHPTFGLLPEQPLVLDRRLPFPLASVVTLTPVVWQSRSPRVPCRGFGSLYNTEVMRPERGAKTAFTSSRSAQHTGRRQTIFLSYEEDALICVDRSQLVDSTFFDKSWRPWATYEEMQVGRPTTSKLFKGKPVYYNFVSDVSYIQAPAPGAVRLTRDPCTDGDMCKNMRSDDVSCVDPLQAGPEHPVWSNAKDLTYMNCSARSVWDSMYLNTPQESWSELRRNTFFTIETSELNVGSLVITPRIDGVRNVVTLVRASFTMEQSGFMHGKVYVESTSEKMWTWYLLGALVLLMALIYFILTWRNSSARELSMVVGRWTQVYDSILSLGCSAHVISSLIIDLTSPRISDDLLRAFHLNSQEEYFSTLSSIAVYNQRLQASRTYGFILITFLFGRLCIYASLHPRLAMIVSTLARSADDLLHFVIYTGTAEMFLAFFAHWAFGQQMVEYSNLSNVFWTQFRMFVGDFDMLPEESPDTLYVIYVITYVFVVFIMMMNFLLAILVEAYASAQESIKEDRSESTIVVDVVDVFRMWVLSRRRGWPSPKEMWRYLSTTGLGICDEVRLLPAVTAEELLENVRKCDGVPVFRSLEQSRDYCNFYADKVKDEGEYPLLENRAECLFAPGQFFHASDERNVAQEPMESPLSPVSNSSFKSRYARRSTESPSYPLYSARGADPPRSSPVQDVTPLGVVVSEGEVQENLEEAIQTMLILRTETDQNESPHELTDAQRSTGSDEELMHAQVHPEEVDEDADNAAQDFEVAEAIEGAPTSLASVREKCVTPTSVSLASKPQCSAPPTPRAADDLSILTIEVVKEGCFGMKIDGVKFQVKLVYDVGCIATYNDTCDPSKKVKEGYFLTHFDSLKCEGNATEIMTAMRGAKNGQTYRCSFRVC